MKISKLVIKNYRNINNVDIELNNIGKNNCGKNLISISEIRVDKDRL
ncbi:hypothetical protein [Clostridium sp.]|jgi:predicted ATP-dependent endonuclease of OLD family|nr:hypothetical protein [Clostridium sp.]MDF2503029.1 ATPase domain [Clostridium sp.]